MDCRRINKYIKDPSFPEEDISAVADLIEADDNLITVDIKDGFQHVPIYVKSRKVIGKQSDEWTTTIREHAAYNHKLQRASTKTSTKKWFKQQSMDDMGGAFS